MFPLNVFMKKIEIVNTFEGPYLVRESKLLTKDQLQMKLNILKTLWASEFDNLTNFPENEIKQWLVNFVNDSEDHLTLIQ